mmetsp:Transcript_69882/g.166766  ORF Transcript_69882/g.166766 Transcript_69882/m.166766 type:complete len:211 (-) Transcript_69882:1077-1709(-)
MIGHSVLYRQRLPFSIRLPWRALPAHLGQTSHDVVILELETAHCLILRSRQEPMAALKILPRQRADGQRVATQPQNCANVPMCINQLLITPILGRLLQMLDLLVQLPDLGRISLASMYQLDHLLSSLLQVSEKVTDLLAILSFGHASPEVRGGQRPEPHGAVGRPGGEQRAVRGQRQATDARGVPHVAVQRRVTLIPDIPSLHAVVVASG